MNHLITGGARGADELFAISAEKEGHDITHYSFKGHKVKGPGDIITMTEDQYEKADSLIAMCNKMLQRNISGMSEHSLNLLRRNMIKVHENPVTSLYAVSYLTEELTVPGGTAWATTIFDLLEKGDMYLFNQADEKWYKHSIIWGFQVMETLPPKPSGMYLGIGSRELINSGRSAIINLYKGDEDEDEE